MTSSASRHEPDRFPRLAAAAIALTIAVANTPQPARALPAYLTAFEAQYPAAKNSRIDNCTLCHTTVPALNPYGTAYGAGHDFVSIESADSDGDGYTNLAEITAFSFPGDPNDTPVPTATTTGGAAVSPTPTTVQAPTGTAGTAPTNTSASQTVTPTAVSGSPTTTSGSATSTKPASTPTAGTPSHGSPTATTSAVHTATRVGPPRVNDDDSCSIVAPERSSGGLILLLAPALLLWARRRRP